MSLNPEPVHVEIKAPSPVPVEIIEGEDALPSANIPSQTTREQDRTSAGQRRVNIIWEVTQASIAVSVTLAGLVVAGSLALSSGENVSSTAGFVFLTGITNLVVGFYFGRTNHQRTGGVGGQSVETTR